MRKNKEKIVKSNKILAFIWICKLNSNIHWNWFVHVYVFFFLQNCCCSFRFITFAICLTDDKIKKWWKRKLWLWSVLRGVAYKLMYTKNLFVSISMQQLFSVDSFFFLSFYSFHLFLRSSQQWWLKSFSFNLYKKILYTLFFSFFRYIYIML